MQKSTGVNSDWRIIFSYEMLADTLWRKNFHFHEILRTGMVGYLLDHSKQSKGRKTQKENIQNAKRAHAMALLLHPLDDHLNDGQIPISHLALLFRSQAWMIMNDALKKLANGIDGGHEIVKSLINNYYSSIVDAKESPSLDHYCDNFKKQMATWLIVPSLLIKGIHNDLKMTEAIQSAYESFGIAWRLLDDINDLKTDVKKGDHSSVYICLPEKIKDYWDKDTEEINNKYDNIIFNYILENGIIEQIRRKIYSELESAASITNYCNMKGLANQFLCLLRPLKNGYELL